MQNLIANLILRETSGNDQANIAMMTIPLPSETLQSDPFTYILQNFVPGFLFLIYILPVYNMVFLIVKEKESRTKESMRMMGMSDLPYWLSWWVYYTCVNAVIATVCWAVLCINVLRSGSVGFIWVWFFLYGEAVFGVIVFIQSMFGKSKFAGIIASLIYFIGSFADYPVIGSYSPAVLKRYLSLIP